MERVLRCIIVAGQYREVALWRRRKELCAGRKCVQEGSIGRWMRKPAVNEMGPTSYLSRRSRRRPKGHSGCPFPSVIDPGG